MFRKLSFIILKFAFLIKYIGNSYRFQSENNLTDKPTEQEWNKI